MREQQYKPVLSVSISPEQRDEFYMALARLRQRLPFVTMSALIVQAVIDAAQKLEVEQVQENDGKTVLQ